MFSAAFLRNDAGIIHIIVQCLLIPCLIETLDKHVSSGWIYETKVSCVKGLRMSESASWDRCLFDAYRRFTLLKLK